MGVLSFRGTLVRVEQLAKRYLRKFNRGKWESCSCRGLMLIISIGWELITWKATLK